jgi:sugar lactone lactonase YvrE
MLALFLFPGIDGAFGRAAPAVAPPPQGKSIATYPASVGAVAVDQHGTVYLATSPGVVALPPKSAPLRTVWVGAATDITLDPAGHLFILDGGCNCVREVRGERGPGAIVFSMSDLPSNVVPATLSSIAVDKTDTVYAVGGTGMIFIKRPHVTFASYSQALYAIDSFMACSIVVDAAGNLYAADQYVGAMAEVPAGNTKAERFTTAATGFANRPGLAIDRAGNLFVAGNHSNTIIEIAAGTHKQRTVVGGLNGPAYVAAADAHYLYVSDTGNDRFVRVDLSSGRVSTIGWALARPGAITEDAAGTLYVADGGNSRVARLSSHGGPPVSLGSGLADPSSLAIDARGHVIVADPPHNRVVAIDPASGRQQDVAPMAQLHDPISVAADGHGDVYIADFDRDRVLQVAPDGVTTTPVGSGWIYPAQVAADAAGDVFVVIAANETLFEVPANRTAPVPLNHGQPIPGSMTADAAGTVYLDDGAGHLVKMLSNGTTQKTVSTFPQGRYFIDTAGNLFIVTSSAIIEYAPQALDFRPS